MSGNSELSIRETQLLHIIDVALQNESEIDKVKLQKMKHILTSSNLSFEAEQWIKMNYQLIELAKERSVLDIKHVKMNYYNNYIEEIEKSQDKFLSNLNQKIKKVEITEGPDSNWVNRAKELEGEILSYTIFSTRKSVYRSEVSSLKKQLDSLNEEWNKLIHEVKTYGL